MILDFLLKKKVKWSYEGDAHNLISFIRSETTGNVFDDGDGTFSGRVSEDSFNVAKKYKFGSWGKFKIYRVKGLISHRDNSSILRLKFDVSHLSILYISIVCIIPIGILFYGIRNSVTSEYLYIAILFWVFLDAIFDLVRRERINYAKMDFYQILSKNLPLGVINVRTTEK